MGQGVINTGDPEEDSLGDQREMLKTTEFEGLVRHREQVSEHSDLMFKREN